MPVADPAEGGILAGVDCASGSFCVAVGYQGTESTTGPPLIETFNGTRWTVTRTPQIAGTGELRAVSCPVKGNCYAVGYRQDGWPIYGLLLHLTRGRWGIVTNPPHTNSHQQLDLTGIDCPTATRCLAVGHRMADPNITLTGSAAWRLLDGRWQVVNPPIDPNYSSQEMSSVSCPTAAVCVAVGSAYTNTWHADVMRYDFHSWHYEKAPRADQYSALATVRCYGPRGWCLAIGTHGGTNLTTLVDERN